VQANRRLAVTGWVVRMWHRTSQIMLSAQMAIDLHDSWSLELHSGGSLILEQSMSQAVDRNIKVVGYRRMDKRQRRGA